MLPEAKANPNPDRLLEGLGEPAVLESTLDELENGLTGRFQLKALEFYCNVFDILPLDLLGRRENSTGLIQAGQYPHPDDHGLGIFEILELIGSGATVNDLDDHARLLAGGILLGLNLGRNKNARGLDLTRSFRERDL